MKQFVLKFKNQQTIPTDGIDLWKTILYSVEKDKDGEVQRAARKLLGLDRDRYFEVHGPPKQKQKRAVKPPPPPPPHFPDKKGRALAKFRSVLGKHTPIQVEEEAPPTPPPTPKQTTKIREH